MLIKILYNEIENNLLNNTKPSVYMEKLLKDNKLNIYPFTMLKELKETKQSPKHHPEGDVWNHTMMVIDNASKVKGNSEDLKVFMWAALLHDIGKPSTTRIRNNRITSYDHDKVGEVLTKEFLLCFTDCEEFIYNVSKLVRYHMHIMFIVKDMPYKNTKGLLTETNIKDVALLGFCDRMGRTNSDSKKVNDIINKFLEKIKSIKEQNSKY